MAPIAFTRLFGTSGRRAIESIVPRRTLDDVILPPATGARSTPDWRR